MDPIEESPELEEELETEELEIDEGDAQDEPDAPPQAPTRSAMPTPEEIQSDPRLLQVFQLGMTATAREMQNKQRQEQEETQRQTQQKTQADQYRDDFKQWARNTLREAVDRQDETYFIEQLQERTRNEAARIAQHFSKQQAEEYQKATDARMAQFDQFMQSQYRNQFYKDNPDMVGLEEVFDGLIEKGVDAHTAMEAFRKARKVKPIRRAEVQGPGGYAPPTMTKKAEQKLYEDAKVGWRELVNLKK